MKLMSKHLPIAVATPVELQSQVQAPECKGMVFHTEYGEKSFYVGLGIGEIAKDRLWFSPVCKMVVRIMCELPVMNMEFRIAQIDDPLDVKEILEFSPSGSRILLLGEMTDILQNGILRELNVS